MLTTLIAISSLSVGQARVCQTNGSLGSSSQQRSGQEKTQCQRLNTQFKSANQWHNQFSTAIAIPCFTISGQFDPNVTMYLDEAFMVNGSNGEKYTPSAYPLGCGRTGDGTRSPSSSPANCKIIRGPANFSKCTSVSLACPGCYGC